MATCVVCGDEEKEDTPLRQTSCGEHWMCDSCLEQTFQLALRDESKYHPRCCGSESSVLLIGDYEDYLPFELAFDYQVKEREYSIQPRFRVYCGSKTCGHFIHPDNYKQDPADSALCDSCDSLTCVKCKTLIDVKVSHTCVIPEAEVKFQEAVKEHKYQRCTCNFVIELAEACNHISCECGRQFCYICGKDWNGYHGCPAYGHPQYDDEGYNQDGFHKDTGLNRNGHTRQGQIEADRFGPDGFDDGGRDRQGFDRNGFDINGFNAEGLDGDGNPRMPDDIMEEHRIALEAQNIELGNFQPEEDDAETESEGSEEGEGEDIEGPGEGEPTGEVAAENGGNSESDEDEDREGHEGNDIHWDGPLASDDVDGDFVNLSARAWIDHQDPTRNLATENANSSEEGPEAHTDTPDTEMMDIDNEGGSAEGGEGKERVVMDAGQDVH